MQILQESGIRGSYYRYYDESTLGLDMAGMAADLMAAPNGTIVVLHACAHNPTGVDPSKEQWQELVEICADRQHVVVFDCAYLGFVSGSVDTDAFAMRLFAQRGLSFFICISFSKNFGKATQAVPTHPAQLWVCREGGRGESW
jgi:aspartate/tyrosine/aromatic aminotransferase